MKKRILSILLSLTISAGLFSACGKTESTDAPKTEPGAATQTSTDASQIKIANLLNGTLGDKAFFDSAANGSKMIKDELGIDSKVVEMTYDETKWDPTLIDFSEDPEYNVIITGTWQMSERVQDIAPKYPEKKYIIYDSTVDYDLGGLDNVYSIEYKQNECSFLVGAVAALKSETGTIGFVGGMENYVINDFLLGYIQGAKYINPDIKINIAYIGNFSDSARAKELTLAQINQNSDVVYQVASTAGLGVIDACVEKGVWAIGVDNDQSEAFRETDPAKSKAIITSALKKVDESLYRTIKAQTEGTLEYGQRVEMGLADDAVGIAKNDVYKENMTEEQQAKIDEIEKGILDGSIVVESAFGKTTDEIEAVRASVR